MKKFWKKYKVIIIVVLAVLAFTLLSILSENSRKVETSLNDFKDNFGSDEYAVTVIGLTFCDHCHNFSPIIRGISKEYSLPLYWFDIDALSKEDSDYLYEVFEPYGYSGSSPYIAVSNKGKVIDSHTGEMDKETTLTFLKDTGAIK